MLKDLVPNFGDGIVQTLSVDWVGKKITLVLKQFDGNDGASYTISTLVFTDVAWQSFDSFNSFNLFWGIAYSENLTDFESNEKEYLDLNRNYFSPGELEKMMSNTALVYYRITSSAGLGGFIISGGFSFAQQKVDSVNPLY